MSITSGVGILQATTGKNEIIEKRRKKCNAAV
jgi:hypothetical protein